tara:strand:- start:344 stop:565 length:222 start_codon:yes stop_codon:yes gene_type:complete
MEVFKVWLGDYGLVVRQDCLDVGGNRTLYSVNKVDIEVKDIELVDCCLTKAEVAEINFFEALTEGEALTKVTK